MMLRSRLALIFLGAKGQCMAPDYDVLIIGSGFGGAVTRRLMNRE
jgi:hypothetical protein